MAAPPVPPGGTPPMGSLLQLLEKAGTLPGPLKFVLKLGIGVAAAEASGGVITKHGMESVKLIKRAVTGELREEVEDAGNKLKGMTGKAVETVPSLRDPKIGRPVGDLSQLREQQLRELLSKLAAQKNTGPKNAASMAAVKAELAHRARSEGLLRTFALKRDGRSTHVPMETRDP